MPPTTAPAPAPCPGPAPLHIAIIGASISGLTLAIALSKRNISYTLYEAAPNIHALGAGIAFGPNALRAMGLIDPQLKSRYDAIATGNSTPGKEHVFCEMLLCEPGFGMASKDRWWQGNGDGDGGARVEYESFVKSSCLRGELMAVLSGLVPEERVLCGMRAVSVTQGGGGVAIGFADGSVVVADAVVGCDGGKGITRKAVLGEDIGVGHPVLSRSHLEDVDATYAGRYVYRAVVPMEDAKRIMGEYAGDGKMFLGEERYFATYQMSGGAHLNLLAGRQDDRPWNHDQWIKEVTREEMLKDFKGCDSRLVRLLEYAKPTRWSLHHHLSTPTYFNKLICLVGDAAHASTPHQGAGAGQCLEDALILSHLLSLVSSQQNILLTPSSHAQWRPQDREVDISHVFQAYDSIRRPRAQKVVRTSDDAGKMYCFADPECGSDVEKIVANARERFRWIWEVDLWDEVQRAERKFKELQEEYRGFLR